MITPGSRVRVKVSLGAISAGHECTVLEVWDCGDTPAASCDIEANCGDWRMRFTVWSSELELVAPP